jgi:glycosyltransferase involved in cell wall biosynthesis
MRVAHILRKYVPAEWGGTETALLGLTTGLAQQDVQSVIYHPVAGRAASDPMAASGCEMRPFHAHLPVLGLPKAAREEMIAIGGNLLSFDLPWMLTLEPGLDVIHSHVLGRLGGIAGTVARRRNIPFVVTIHGGVLAVPDAMRQSLAAPRQHRSLEWGQLFGWWWRARHVLAEADAILTCNAREAELLRERYPHQHIVVQPHGVNTILFRTDQRAVAREAYPAIAGRDVLLCVARVDPVKNQAWLVHQLPAILQRHPNAMLVLAGACTNVEYGAQLQADIQRLGLADRVLLTGGLPPGNPRLIGLMQSARVAILPSLNETFGLVIPEAWAASLPMLASRTAGSLDLVEAGEDACLFEPEKPAEFHAQLDRLMLDAAFRERLIAAGHLKVRRFDTVTMTGQVRQLYARLHEEKHALRHSA